MRRILRATVVGHPERAEGFRGAAAKVTPRDHWTPLRYAQDDDLVCVIASVV